MKRSRIWRRLMISHLSIWLVAMIAGSVVYFVAADNIMEEINTVNRYALKQVQLNIDLKLKEIRQFSLNLGYKPGLQSILYGPYRALNQYRYNIYKNVEEFKLYNIANKFIDTFFVYCADAPLVLSPMGTYDIELIAQSRYGLGMRDAEAWKKLFEARYDGRLMIAPAFEAGTGMRDVWYMQTLPVGIQNENVGTVAIKINAQEISDIIEDAEYSEGMFVYIIDSNERILFSSNADENPFAIAFSDLEQRGESFEETWNGGKVMVNSDVSDVADWRYVTIVPMNEYLIRLNTVRNFTLLAFFACGVLGVLLTMVFARRHVKPVHEILNAIVRKNIAPEIIGTDEYERILGTLSSVSERETEMKNLIYKQNLLVEEHLLLQQLLGTNEGAKLTGDWEAFALVALVSVSEYGVLNHATFSFTVKKVMDEMGAHAIRCRATEDGKRVAFVLSGPRATDLVTFASDRMVQICALFEREFGALIRAGISEAHAQSIPINHVYRQALEALEMSEMINGNPVALYSLLYEDDAQFSVKLSISAEVLMMKAVAERDYEQTANVLCDSLEYSLFSESIPVEIVRSRMQRTIDLAYRAICELNGADEAREAARALSGRVGVDDLCAAIRRIFKDLQQSDLSLVRSDNDAEQVKCYVDKNFADSNLNVSQLASAFGMNPNHLSKEFLHQYGIRLLDYIHQKRIAHAKLLIIEGVANVMTIASQSGYASADVFIRTFKKIEGITPGKLIAACEHSQESE